MPISNAQNDVANSGTRPGFPIKNAGFTVSALPTGPLGRKNEEFFVPAHITPSGANIALTNRFDDPTYYAS